MENKVKYKTKSNKKYLVIAIIACIVIIVFICALIEAAKSLKDDTNLNTITNATYSSSSYGSLEELLEKYNCKLISESVSDDIINIYLTFDMDLYTGEQSNQAHFLTIAKEVALYENYKDFKLIDDSKNIVIEVKCEDTNITEFIINGDYNYYLNHDSDMNVNKNTAVTSFTIQSNELKELINYDWKISKVDLGTVESTFNNYQICFDEGIKYRVISTKVFNIIFTTNYTGKIVGNLNASSTLEEVENALGTPTFSKDNDLYGYKGTDNYVFFDFLNSQVSIYPVETIEEEETLISYINDMNDSYDVMQFISDLTEMWPDYDVYNYSSNMVNLKYSLRGIKIYITESSLENGIYIYQNYSGNMSDLNNLSNVYIKGTDLVFDTETDRMLNEKEKAYGASQQDNPESSLYYVELEKDYNGDIRTGKFISKDNTMPDVEINDSIYTLVWISDTEIIYSIKNKGLYYYNFNEMSKQELLKGNDEYYINSFEDGILSYDDSSLQIN